MALLILGKTRCPLCSQTIEAGQETVATLLRIAGTILSTLCALGPTNAHAWGADGHRLIAELAAAQLTPVARAEIDRLLSLEPGATLVSVSTWADETRSGATAPLHYVNPPEGDCNYSRQRDCPDGRCVVEAITAKVAILKSNAPDAERLVALKYVVHLVGDIHQPLHVGLPRDKGGNLFQVRAFGRGTNLHAVWDGDLIRHRAGGLSQLLRDVNALEQRTASSPAEPARWAAESCRLSRTASFYPEDRSIGMAYQVRWDDSLVVQFALAGRRLAGTLNEAMIQTR
ncbi:S1/P1 nuclease [Roseateles sp. P5_D6]